MAEMEDLLSKIEKGPDDFASVLQGAAEPVLSRRPDEKNWAPKEIICHLRDTEELFLIRFQAIVAMDEPKYAAVDADRWAEERQYLRNDAREALAAFRRRRADTLRFLQGLTPGQWDRTGVHATRGRETLRQLGESIARHDLNHLDQLKRALDGRP
jgi:DinB superfamily